MLAKATKQNVRNLMQKQTYPITFYNTDEEDYEIEVLSYANVLIEDVDDEPDAVGLVITYPDTHPTRYIVTEIDASDDTFVSRDQQFEIDSIDG